MTDLTLAPPRSPWRDATTRLARNRAAVVSAIILGLITLACVLGPMLSGYELDAIDWDKIQTAPDGDHWFGTDGNGRDLLVRVLTGGRISLALGIAATLVAVLIGVTWGALAGYLGGAIDALLMRVVDVLYALPFMFFVILLMVFFGRDPILMFVALGAVSWLDMARIVRGQTLSLKRQDFVRAAQAMGAPTSQIVRRHIVPNLMGPVVVFATLTVPQVILFESFLSFLGLGVQEPMTSWGVLISEGAESMQSSPWMLLFPGVFLATTLFCLNFIGDGLRDALDPRDH
ncbi:MAG: ABC transporter permease subunit [Alphaproteobacteria bacterium]